MKALLIDVTKRKVEEIDIDGSLSSIYAAMGDDVTCFSVPVQYENGDGIYADDEALLGKDIKGAFIMENWQYPLVNNCLVIGCDYSTGDSCDVITTAEELQKQIKWLSLTDLIIGLNQ